MVAVVSLRMKSSDSKLNIHFYRDENLAIGMRV